MLINDTSPCQDRRGFLIRSLGTAAAFALGAGAPLVLTSRKSVVRASGFPSFNTSGISASTLSNFTSTFLGLANDIYSSGTTSASALNNGQQLWGELYQQLLTSGFDSAAVEYIQEGVPDPDPQINPLYNALVSNGLQQGWGYFYAHIGGGLLNSAWTNYGVPPIDQYGVPDTNYGHQCSLAHFATVLGGSATMPSQKSYPPIGRGLLRGPSPACGGGGEAVGPLCAPPPDTPGESEDWCFYLNAFMAYVGIMAIPLSLEGAAYPPLGVGLGIGVAFASAFLVAFC